MKSIAVNVDTQSFGSHGGTVTTMLSTVGFVGPDAQKSMTLSARWNTGESHEHRRIHPPPSVAVQDGAVLASHEPLQGTTLYGQELLGDACAPWVLRRALDRPQPG